MGSEAVVTITGSAAQILAEWEKESKAKQKAILELQQLKKVSRELGDTQTKMSAGAKQALDQSTSAADKYRTTMASLRTALDSGRITEEKYNAARKAAQQTFQASSEAFRKRNELLKEGAAVSERVATAEQHHAKEVERLGKLFKAGAIDGLTYMRALSAADQTLKEATKDTKALAEAEKLEAKAKQHATDVTNANKSPQERYVENVRLAKKALDQGRITQETYNRELVRQQALLREVPSSFATWATSLFTVTAAYRLLGGAIRSVIQHEKERLQLAADKGKEADDAARKFQIQAGQTELETKESQKKILGVAAEVGASSPEAKQAATELVSANFSPEQATGDALRTLLLTQRATGGEASTRELAFSMSSFLESQGLEKTGQNMAMLGVGLKSVTKGQFKLQNFPDLAKEAAVFKGKLSVPEQLSAAAVLADTGMPVAEAATAMRSLVVRGGTADTKKKQAALKKMGLKNTDVDFIGDNLDTVLGNIERGLAGMDETKRESALKTLFEEQAIAPIKTLMAQRAKLKEYQSGFGDVEGFNKAAAAGTSGVTAGLNREKIKEEMILLDRYGVSESVRQQVLKNKFDSLPAGGAIRGAVESVGAAASAVGANRDQAETGAFRGLISGASNMLLGSGMGSIVTPLVEARVGSPANTTDQVSQAMKGVERAIDKQTETMIRAMGNPAAPQAPLIGPTGGDPAFTNPGVQ